MKPFAIIFLILIFSVCNHAQKLNENFDSILAKKFNADDYGMKNYTLVLLKTGPVTIEDKARVNELFKGHLSNISRLVDEGKMIVAGPFAKNDLYRGLFILDTSDPEEAAKLMDTDPAIKAQLLEPVYIKWYGSAALSSYLEYAKKVGKYGF
ncbi:MAG: hypothetical protein IPM34_13985 [Saprospiraceae bacterium]|nr:hypothetical protein [Saprospiraceae bacterium]